MKVTIMARPMYLIRRPLLEELYAKYKDGVPVSRLIQQHDLGLTPPTLTKLLMYVAAAEEASTDIVGELINASIYPEWLDEEPIVTEKQVNNVNVVLQSPQWRYEGKMPLGEWVKNEWAKK